MAALSPMYIAQRYSSDASTVRVAESRTTEVAASTARKSAVIDTPELLVKTVTTTFFVTFWTMGAPLTGEAQGTGSSMTVSMVSVEVLIFGYSMRIEMTLPMTKMFASVFFAGTGRARPCE